MCWYSICSFNHFFKVSFYQMLFINYANLLLAISGPLLTYKDPPALEFGSARLFLISKWYFLRKLHFLYWEREQNATLQTKVSTNNLWSCTFVKKHLHLTDLLLFYIINLFNTARPAMAVLGGLTLSITVGNKGNKVIKVIKVISCACHS